MRKKLLPAIVCAFLLLPLSTSSQIATGGAYRLEQSVTASGGGESAGGIYKIEGTTGQAAAGIGTTAAPYAQIGGFWTPPILAPTAAGVILGGQVVTAGGTGISGATITLTGGSLTAPLIVRTNNFGYFAFPSIAAGQLYVLTVRHKKYAFAQDSRVLMLLDDRRDIVFQADWEN